LNNLPYESVVGKVESLLAGERSVDFVVAEIQMVFQTMSIHESLNGFRAVDRPSLDWINSFQNQ
jgi:hypothetical protein